MKVYTVPEIIALPLKAVPDAFAGRVKKVITPTRSKPGDARQWTMQKLIVESHGQELEVMFSDRPDVPRTVEGQNIHIVAGRGGKGDLTGLMRKENEWRQKINPQLWVYDKADVTFSAADGSQQRQEAPPQEQQQRQPDTSRPANGHQASPRLPNGHQANGATRTKDDVDAAVRKEIKKFNIRLGKNAVGLARCIDAAFGLVADANERHKAAGGFKLDAGQIKEVATTLFINTCDKDNRVADILDFPIRPFQHYDLKTNGEHAGTAAGGQQRQDGPPFN